MHRLHIGETARSYMAFPLIALAESADHLVFVVSSDRGDNDIIAVPTASVTRHTCGPPRREPALV